MSRSYGELPYYWHHTDDYLLLLTHEDGKDFVHCYCYRWTPGVKRALTADFNRLLKERGYGVFARQYLDDDEKHKKFLKMFGFWPVHWGKDPLGDWCHLCFRGVKP